MDFITEQQSKQISIRDRFALYYQAYSKDIDEIQNNKCAWPARMGKAALQCLVNYKSPKPEFIETEVQMVIMGAINQIREMSKKTKIRKS